MQSPLFNSSSKVAVLMRERGRGDKGPLFFQYMFPLCDKCHHLTPEHTEYASN